MAEVRAQFKDPMIEHVQGPLVETQSTQAVRICTNTAGVDKELVEMQSVLPGALSTMYRLVQSGDSLQDAELQQADWELSNGMRERKLYAYVLTELWLSIWGLQSVSGK